MSRALASVGGAGLSGLLFGLGLGVAGMTQPAKVVAFLDVFGAWDPSLAFVMAAAIAVHAVAYRLVRRRARPMFDARFHLPTRTDLDRRLLVGSALFGIGWGIGGYCPGPGLVSLVTLGSNALVFVLAMTTGMLLQHAFGGSPSAARPAGSKPAASATT